MEESVALDSSKQKEFVKSVRGIKKLLKKKGPIASKKKLVEQPNKKTEKSGRKNVKKRRNRGLVYLAHIPHGFYEHQMTEYFKQFGAVTNVRVIRSKRTGASKGYAFVEFKEPSVAEIVAETMNNYLMGKRLIKAVYIPPEKQKIHAQRKNWNSQMNPASEQRLKIKKAFNADKTDAMELKIARKLLSNLLKTKSKLSELGIDYNFMPVDIPEALQNEVDKINSPVREASTSDIKSNNKIKVEDIKSNKTEKKFKNEPQEEINVEKGKSKKKRNKKNKKSEVVQETDSNKTVTVLVTDKVTKDEKKDSKTVTVPVADKVAKDEKKVMKEPKLKQNKIKLNNIKPPQNFVSIKQDSESDDEFDSDAFERMMADDDDDDLSSLYDEDDEQEDEIEEPKRKVVKRKATKGNIKPAPALRKDNFAKVEKASVSGAAKNVKKRKNNEKTSLPLKKAKFEKQHKKAMKKVIKKKK